MRFQDDGPPDGADALVLGGVVFEAFEIPAKLSFGIKQKLVVQHFPGGGKEVQAMGADPQPLAWSGRFRGAGAADDAAAVNEMARAGALVLLSWSMFLYDVVIRDFKADFEQAYEIPYKITCEVVRDRGGDGAALPPAAEALFAGDLADIAGFGQVLDASGLGITGLGATGAGMGIDAALAAVAQSAGAVAGSGLLGIVGDRLSGAVGAVGTGLAAGASLVGGASAAVATARGLCLANAATANALIGGAALAGGTGPALAAASLTGTANALTAAATASQLAFRLTRIGNTLAKY